MGEKQARVFAAIVLVPILGVLLLAVFGINYHWLVGASPGTPMLGLLIALAILFGGTVLSLS